MQNPTFQLNTLIADAWEYRQRANPIAATFCGDHRYDDRLPEISPAALEAEYAQTLSYQAQLQAVDRQALSPADQLNYDCFAHELDIQTGSQRFGVNWMPFTRLSGPQYFLPDLVEVTPFTSGQDYEAYLTRLAGFRKLAQGYISIMREGIRRGYTLPHAALQGIEASFQAHITQDSADSLYYRPFKNIPAHVGAAQAEKMRQAARQAILASVIPAHQDWLAFMQSEYLPAARQEIAASHLPDGEQYYAHSVRRYTSLAVSPSEVFETGMAEVQRIRSEMLTLIEKTGFRGSFHEFLAYLRTEPRFYVASPEALLKEAAFILKRMDGELPRLFKLLPRTPYGIRQIPDFLAPRSTTAYYFPTTGDGKTAGYFYVNTYDLKSRPLYEYEALSFHEAVPGHHLQLALQMELDLPNFRRFGNSTAFVEGWALYAERLGLEAGFYTDLYSDFGRLTFEMWRAARLVVDPGMHALGWSRQHAIDFMSENTALAQLNIANEVDRYIAWPGQALAYKMGELAIRRLRGQAEAAFGGGFDLREFHKVVLEDGGVPLSALENKVQSWIKNAGAL